MLRRLLTISSETLSERGVCGKLTMRSTCFHFLLTISISSAVNIEQFQFQLSQDQYEIEVEEIDSQSISIYKYDFDSANQEFNEDIHYFSDVSLYNLSNIKYVDNPITIYFLFFLLSGTTFASYKSINLGHAVCAFYGMKSKTLQYFYICVTKNTRRKFIRPLIKCPLHHNEGGPD